MEMEPQRPVVMMVVEVHVVPAPSDRNVVVELVSVLQTAQADNVVMMDVEETLADLAPHHKPVTMVFVPELPSLIVLEDNAVTTELEETAVTAQLVKDADQDSVNATMTVTTETVVMHLKLMEPTLVCAHKDLVDLAQVDSPVELLEDALPKHLVMFLLQLLTVPLAELLLPQVQSSSLQFL